jgi:hypothetical protein
MKETANFDVVILGTGTAGEFAAHNVLRSLLALGRRARHDAGLSRAYRSTLSCLSHSAKHTTLVGARFVVTCMSCDSFAEAIQNDPQIEHAADG